jgi:hypothetical protein
MGMPAVTDTVFAKLKKEPPPATEEIAVPPPEDLGEDAAETESVTHPEEKGGGDQSTLFDIPYDPQSKELAKYTTMLDNEFGLVVDMESNEWSLRIGKDIVPIPKLSEFLGGEDDGEGDLSSGKIG